MTHPAVNSDQVGALFAERQRYESWLSTLESKRATTPPHIYHRVHSDYTARLQRVIEQLATHRVVLQELETNLMDRLTSLDIDEAKHRDEAAEAELRAAVGELSAEHHQEIAERTESALAQVNQERAGVMEELGRLRAILEAGGIAPAEPRKRAAESAPVEAPTGPTKRPAGAGGAQASAQTPPAKVPSPHSDWDLSFEKTPEPARPAAGPSAPPRRPSEPKVAPPEAGPFDDLEFLKTMVDQRPSGESVAVGSGVGPGSVDRAHAASGNAAGGAGVGNTPSVSQPQPTAVEGVNVRHTEEVVLSAKEAPVEQVKTLKCQECGTLNYPTEWYCERCGAELAAL